MLSWPYTHSMENDEKLAELILAKLPRTTAFRLGLNALFGRLPTTELAMELVGDTQEGGEIYIVGDNHQVTKHLEFVKYNMQRFEED